LDIPTAGVAVMAKSVELDGKLLRVYFSYNPKIVDALRGIPGREFRDSPVKHWTLPAHSWHARQAVRVLTPLGFQIAPEVLTLAVEGEQIEAQAAADKGHELVGLKDYQKECVEFALKHDGRVIFTDPCGMGKTVEALGYASRRGFTRILTATQASVLYKWQEEFKRWLGMDVPVVESFAEAWPASPSHIMSYSILTRRPEVINQEYDLFILDEAHYVKNHKSARTKKALLVGKGIPHILPLTATPFPNRPQEIWNLAHLLDPVGWKNLYDFMRRYCGGVMIDGTMIATGPTNTEELAERLGSLMIGHPKTRDAYTFRRVFLDVNLPNMAFYQQVKEEVIEALRKLDPNSPGYFQNALAKLTALREVVGIGKAYHAVAWAKNFLEEADAKLVLYAHHKSVVQLLLNGLSGYSIDALVGDVPNKKRDDIRKAFQYNADPRVLVISSAGGMGIDLFGVGQDNSNILFVEREWNPGLEEQPEGRLDREGQTLPVTAWYLVARKTVDMKWHRFVGKKRETIKKLIPMEDVPTEFLESVIHDLLTGQETDVE